jgi:glycyl-tRNA synthetase beta chain
VLTTTLIHHQHFFPVEGENGRLKSAFLAVINTEPDAERTIARNAERVVTARLRDARFFWEADRRATLESRLGRLDTLLFHKKLGSYREKAERIAALAKWISINELAADEQTADYAFQAARLAKADLTTDMVREFTELQGTMGGIYAREEGLPEEIWKAIYFHYLPVGVEADAPPTREQLQRATSTWAAVSLADKLDTLLGLFAAGEKPTGSRDPYGLRRAAQGVVKIITDLPNLGVPNAKVNLVKLVDRAYAPHAALNGNAGWEALPVGQFLWERKEHLLQRRGYKADEIRVVAALNMPWGYPRASLQRVKALSEVRSSPEFQALAGLFKRVKNITKGVEDATIESGDIAQTLKEPAELQLAQQFDQRWPSISAAIDKGEYATAMRELGSLYPPVDRFFTDVLVMAEDPKLRRARLALLTRLRNAVLQNIGDISEIAPEEGRQA